MWHLESLRSLRYPRKLTMVIKGNRVSTAGGSNRYGITMRNKLRYSRIGIHLPSIPLPEKANLEIHNPLRHSPSPNPRFHLIHLPTHTTGCRPRNSPHDS